MKGGTEVFVELFFVGGRFNGVGSGFYVRAVTSFFGLCSEDEEGAEAFGVGALADDFGNDDEPFIFYLLSRR